MHPSTARDGPSRAIARRDLPALLRGLRPGHPAAGQVLLSAIADHVEKRGCGEATPEAILNNAGLVARALAGPAGPGPS